MENPFDKRTELAMYIAFEKIISSINEFLSTEYPELKREIVLISKDLLKSRDHIEQEYLELKKLREDVKKEYLIIDEYKDEYKRIMKKLSYMQSDMFIFDCFLTMNKDFFDSYRGLFMGKIEKKITTKKKKKNESKSFRDS